MYREQITPKSDLMYLRYMYLEALKSSKIYQIVN